MYVQISTYTCPASRLAWRQIGVHQIGAGDPIGIEIGIEDPLRPPPCRAPWGGPPRRWRGFPCPLMPGAYASRRRPHDRHRKTQGQVVRYSFPVGLFHSLLHAGLSRRSDTRRWPHGNAGSAANGIDLMPRIRPSSRGGRGSSWPPKCATDAQIPHFHATPGRTRTSLTPNPVFQTVR